MKRFVLAFALAMPSACLAQSCVMNAQPQLLFQSPTPTTLAQTVYTQVDVDCDAGVSYQVEVQNASPGGRVDLIAPGVAESVPIVLLASDTQQPWGAFNQGEALQGVGSGARISHGLEARLSLDRLPAPGRYSALLNIVLVF